MIAGFIKNKKEERGHNQEREKAFEQICIPNDKKIPPAADEAYPAALGKETDYKSDAQADYGGVVNVQSLFPQQT